MFPHICIEYTPFFIFKGNPLPTNVAKIPPFVPVLVGDILLMTRFTGIALIEVISAYPILFICTFGF